MPPLWTTAINLVQIPPLWSTTIKLNSNAAVLVVGFSGNQMPAFPLSALRPTLGKILGTTVILFYFFKNRVFPYKTPIGCDGNN